MSIKGVMLLMLVIAFGKTLWAQLQSVSYKDSSFDNNQLVDSTNKYLSNKLLFQKGDSGLKKQASNADKISMFGCHGAVMVEGQYADRQFNYQQLPNSYLRWTIAPELTLFGLPFKSAINLTTEQGKVNYNMNRFSLSLDVNTLKTVMARRLKNNISNNGPGTFLNQKMWEDSLSKETDISREISKLKEKLKNDSAELRQLQNSLPKSLQTELPDSISQNDIRYRLRYKHFVEKKHEYETTLKMIDSLDAIERDFEKYKKQYEKLKQNGAFDNDYINRYNGNGFPDKYKKHPALSRMDRFLLSFRNFSAGTISVDNSSVHTQGATINGVSVENGFGKLYTQLSAGLLYQQLTFGSLKQNTPQKYLYSAKAGYGMPEGSHLHFGIVKMGYVGKQKEEVWNDTSINPHKPGIIYSIDGRINIKENINVVGNWAITETGNDYTTASSEREVHGQKYNILEIPNSSWSLAANSNFNDGKTKISTQLLRVGTAFYSVANPYLRADLLRHEVKITQKLYKNFISFTGTYRKDRDNLLNQKQYTTSITNYKATLNIRLKKLPSFVLSYNNVYQNSEAGVEQSSFVFFTQTEIYTLTSIYNKRIKNKTLTTTLTLIHQQVGSSFSSVKRYFNNVVYTAALFSQKGVGINYSSSFSLENGPLKNMVFNNQVDGFYTYPKKPMFITTGGVFYTYDKYLGNSGGIFIKQTAALWKKSSIALLIKENFFKHIYSNSALFQTIVNIQITQKW